MIHRNIDVRSDEFYKYYMIKVFKRCKCNILNRLSKSFINMFLVIIFMTIAFSVSACSKEIESANETMEETKSLSQTLGISLTDYRLILANIDNSIGDYTPKLVEIEHGREFDYRAADDLKRFIFDARAAGLNVYLSSTYRGRYVQNMLYERKVEQYGEEVAKTIVLPPGTSEHQTGLAADITDIPYDFKTKEIENTDTFKWLNEHSADYGFILRYPKDKEDITKVIYEPWHFRYVGKEVANYIKENNLCLEEFIELIKNESKDIKSPNLP